MLKPYMVTGQKPNRTPSEHPNPTTKIGSNMGGEFTYTKMVPLVLTHSRILHLLHTHKTKELELLSGRDELGQMRIAAIHRLAN